MKAPLCRRFVSRMLKALCAFCLLVALPSVGFQAGSESRSGTIRLKEGAVLPASSVQLFLAFSPDGRMLASLQEREITLWDVGKGTKLGTLVPSVLPRSWFSGGISFSSDGKRLVCGAVRQVQSNVDETLFATVHQLQLWDVPKRKLVFTLEGHSNA